LAVVVFVVVETTTLAGVGAEDAVRIGLSFFNLVIQQSRTVILIGGACQQLQRRGHA
jgi:hypothetical protein